MTSLILCKFPLFSQHFLMLVLGCTLFPPIYREIENWDFQCCSRLDFPIFPIMKKVKNWSFLDETDKRQFSWSIYAVYSFVSYVRTKIEPWFLSPASREYSGVESTAFLSANNFSKKLLTGVRWTAKYVFFISEAIKRAVSFSKFMCLYAMLLRWDNLKHGFSVA